MTPSDVARRASIGLVAVRPGGGVEWLNDAARAGRALRRGVDRPRVAARTAA